MSKAFTLFDFALNKHCVKNLLTSYLCIASLIPFISCTHQTKNSDDNQNNQINEVVAKPVDSVKVLSLKTVDIFSCVDSIIVRIHNPYNDTVTMNHKYYIHQSDSNKLLVDGTLPNIKIYPQSDSAFKISVGLDSIRYWKRKYYTFTFPAHNDERDIIFHGTILMGNRYKWKNEYVLEPDTVFFEVACFTDTIADAQKIMTSNSLNDTVIHAKSETIDMDTHISPPDTIAKLSD